MSPITKLVHAIAAAALMGLALPASSLAGAVTSTLIPCEKGNQCIVATFDAAPGEANDISVTTGPPSLSGTAYRLHDATAAVQDLADGCIAVDASTVSCSAYSLTVNTGDGNDRFTGPSERLEVNLGPGDDSGISGELNGGAGNEHLAGEMLNGGPGDDVLTASPGTEFSHLTGGPGADTMTGGGTIIASDIDFTRSGDPKPGAEVPAPDRIEGGPANSMLSYRDSRRPVVVDLAGGSGSAREDTIVNVQSVEGGSGDDVLRGDAKANLLFGADGNDRLAGRAGNDLLIGGAGRDSFAGGDATTWSTRPPQSPMSSPPSGRSATSKRSGMTSRASRSAAEREPTRSCRSIATWSTRAVSWRASRAVRSTSRSIRSRASAGSGSPRFACHARKTCAAAGAAPAA